MPTIPTTHKNKTFATFLALVLGGIGAHRFYLRGSLDRLGLLHVTCIPIAGMVWGISPHANPFYHLLPFLVSWTIGFVEALVIGVTPDEKFDAAVNPASGKKSQSSWIIAVLLVVTMMVGTVTLIGTISRLFALLYTGNMDG
ncbi:MAG: NINE protein [Pseudomonadota bacterium]